MGPRHSFWSVLGPAAAPKFGSGSHSARGGIDPSEATGPEREGASRVAEVVRILGEANRVTSRCLQLFAQVREGSGLSGIETLTLIAITHAAVPPTVPQVGRSLGHPRQVIQRAVRVLEQEGLVRPTPNPVHKRAALLAATDAGHELGRSIDAQAAEIIAGLAGGLDLDLGQLTALSEGLIALRDRMDDHMSAGD